jgi:hypothetical protein
LRFCISIVREEALGALSGCGCGRYIIAFGVLGISGLIYVNFLEGREQDGYEQGVESASHGFLCTERRLRRGALGLRFDWKRAFGYL